MRLPFVAAAERLRPGADHGRDPLGGAPVAVVPPDRLAAVQGEVGGADRGLDPVDVEEPVEGMAGALVRFEPVDRLHEAAAVAGRDRRFAIEHPHRRVRFGGLDAGRRLHRRRAVVAGHRQRDLADVRAGTETAAGGRERRCKEQRDRDRRATASHQLPERTHSGAGRDGDLIGWDVLAVGRDQRRRFRHGHGRATFGVGRSRRRRSTVTPAAGLRLPLSS